MAIACSKDSLLWVPSLQCALLFSLNPYCSAFYPYVEFSSERSSIKCNIYYHFSLDIVIPKIICKHIYNTNQAPLQWQIIATPSSIHSWQNKVPLSAKQTVLLLTELCLEPSILIIILCIREEYNWFTSKLLNMQSSLA